MTAPEVRIDQAFCTEKDGRAIRLRADLARFYDTTRDYEAFLEPNYKPDFWTPVREAVRSVVARSSRCVVLEFGAGKTSFGDFLGDLRGSTEFHVQDVTAQNHRYLEAQADRVHAGNLLDLDNSYDIIFSTFVWEHLTSPRSTLAHLLRLLKPGGTLFIACPRYDFPFYLSPSVRHLPRATRFRIALWLLWRRMQVLVSRRPAFLLHCDPAVFHLPWFRDADAVHWASLFDLSYALPKGWNIERVRIPSAGLRGRFWATYLLLFVAIARSNSPG